MKAARYPKARNNRFAYALAGLKHAFRSQRSFQLEALAAVIVQWYAVWAHLSFERWALLTLVSGAVLAAELVNTSLERTVDLIEPRLAAPVRAIKDMLAASVLILAATALLLFVMSLCTS